MSSWANELKLSADKLRQMVPSAKPRMASKIRSMMNERSSIIRDAEMARRLQEEDDIIVSHVPVHEKFLDEKQEPLDNMIFENEWAKIVRVIQSSYEFDYSKLDKLEQETREFVQMLDEKIVCFYTIHHLVGSGNGPDFSLNNSLYIITRSNIYKGNIAISTFCNGGRLIIGPLNIKPYYKFNMQLSQETYDWLTSFCSIVPSTTTYLGNQSGTAEQSYSHSKDLWENMMSSIKGSLY